MELASQPITAVYRWTNYTINCCRENVRGNWTFPASPIVRLPRRNPVEKVSQNRRFWLTPSKASATTMSVPRECPRKPSVSSWSANKPSPSRPLLDWITPSSCCRIQSGQRPSDAEFTVESSHVSHSHAQSAVVSHGRLLHPHSAVHQRTEWVVRGAPLGPSTQLPTTVGHVPGAGLSQLDSEWIEKILQNEKIRYECDEPKLQAFLIAFGFWFFESFLIDGTVESRR